MRPRTVARASSARRMQASVSCTCARRAPSISAARPRTRLSQYVGRHMLTRCQRCFTRSLMLPGGTASGMPLSGPRPEETAALVPGTRDVTDGESSWLAIQKASYSVIRSRTGTSTRRPRARARTAIRSSRPSGMRALHQASPLVVATVTRSPSRTKRSRKRVAVSLAPGTRSGAIRRSSRTIANARPVPRGSLLATTAGGAVSRSSETAPTSKASKLTMSRGRPSSFTTKSSRVSPGTGRPSRSRTTASTVTSSTTEGNVGGGFGAWAPPRPARGGDSRAARKDKTPGKGRRRRVRDGMVQYAPRDEQAAGPQARSLFQPRGGLRTAA